MSKNADKCLKCGRLFQDVEWPRDVGLVDVAKYAGMMMRGHTEVCQQEMKQMLMAGLTPEGAALVDVAFRLGLLS